MHRARAWVATAALFIDGQALGVAGLILNAGRLPASRLARLRCLWCRFGLRQRECTDQQKCSCHESDMHIQAIFHERLLLGHRLRRRRGDGTSAANGRVKHLLATEPVYAMQHCTVKERETAPCRGRRVLGFARTRQNPTQVRNWVSRNPDPRGVNSKSG